MSPRIIKAQKARIIYSIRNEGLSIPDAATTFMVSEQTIAQWFLKKVKTNSSPTAELLKLRRENEELKVIIGGLVFDRCKKLKYLES